MNKIGIIGAGLIGSSWSAIFASKGYEVYVYDKNQEAFSLFNFSNEFCENLGLKTKFVSPGEIIEDVKWKDPEYKIYVDTREQKPLKFKDRQVEIKTLKFGDYTFSSKEATCNCYIERKNLYFY